MNADRFRLTGWLLSGFCLAASTGVILNRHAALASAAREESRAAAELTRARTDAEAALKAPKNARYVCAPRTPDEETAFLLDLRRRARLCGVSIARWSSNSTDYHKKESEPNPAKDVVEGVTKVTCDLALRGSYPALRAFLAELWDGDRLLTMSHIDWNRTESGSELSMSLGRYIAPKSASANVVKP